MFNSSDYNLGNDSVDQVLLLTSDDRSDSITINILDDKINECTESVSIELDFLKGKLVPRVELRPSNIEIVIMDDDPSEFTSHRAINYTMSCSHCHSLPISGIIGFFSEQNNITESNDFLIQHQVNVMFGLINGRMCDDVVVQYSIVDANSTAGDAS